MSDGGWYGAIVAVTTLSVLVSYLAIQHPPCKVSMDVREWSQGEIHLAWIVHSCGNGEIQCDVILSRNHPVTYISDVRDQCLEWTGYDVPTVAESLCRLNDCYKDLYFVEHCNCHLDLNREIDYYRQSGTEGRCRIDGSFLETI